MTTIFKTLIPALILQFLAFVFFCSVVALVASFILGMNIPVFSVMKIIFLTFVGIYVFFGGIAIFIGLFGFFVNKLSGIKSKK